MMAKREDGVAGDVDSTGLVTAPQILVSTAEIENVERAFGTLIEKANGGTCASADTGEDELCLDEILNLYNQPINEEQAWAVCYQCCCALSGRESQPDRGDNCMRRIGSASEVRIQRDGTVSLCVSQLSLTDNTSNFQCTQREAIESLGIIIYKALDYGLKENEERELTPPLEKLIDFMTSITECDEDANKDEGYEAQEEEEEEVEKAPEEITSICCLEYVKKICASHLTTPAEAHHHYQAVCRALFAETMELRTFLSKIKSAKEHLQKMQEIDKGGSDESGSLDDLKNTDWAHLWTQVMQDLRDGVKLKKVQERQYNPLPIEYELTPYEMLMDDIRSKRYTLKKVMVDGDIPPRLKKSAHEVILDFIRSRPPLNPASSRKLKPTPPRPRSLHEKILDEIKSERRLRPVSPDVVKRKTDVSTTDGAARSAASPLINGDMSPKICASGTDGREVKIQRKRLLKAPTLAEMESSESEDETDHKSETGKEAFSSSFDDSSPLDTVGGARKKPPLFLPMSSTPQPERRQPPQRRHSIEKETPTNVRQFFPPSRQSSKSLEEFCYPVECLALTVEEVMHIRQVLVKAELEKFQQYKDIYNALKKGKLCFCCRTKRFSIFTWSYTCQFCKRPVCSQCCKKMRLPSKPYSTLPILSLGPSALQRGESLLKPERSLSTSSHHRQQSSRRSIPKLSPGSKSLDKPDEELQFPKELMEDWSTMEVCVDCRKFISDIINSSRRSLMVANKRARLKRKTQSFYVSSPGTSEYRPSERTISEV